MVQKYFEVLQANPADENVTKALVPVAVKRTNEGMKSLVVREVLPGKLEEALAWAASVVAKFDELEETEFSVDVYMNLGEL